MSWSAMRVGPIGLSAMLVLSLAMIGSVAAGTSQTPSKPYLVVMKQSEIQGTVRFLADEDNKEAQAAHMRIEVWTADGKKKLASTETDDKGAYRLPSLEVGAYRLTVGLLTLDLKVEDPDKVSPETRQIPKTIMVLIPRSLDSRSGDARVN